jgi:MoaA/NifB/PqqE/SkfB family radical SAM enzyme
MKNLRNSISRSIPHILNLIVGNSILRKAAVKKAQAYMYRKIVEEDELYTKNIRFERYTILSNLLNTVERALINKNISSQVRKKIFKLFIGDILLENDKVKQENFIKEFKQEPPGFITISPGKKCNLKCIGCYSASDAKANEKLDYNTVDRIISEKTKLWNSFVTVVSGGEPLMWRSDGKGIMDIFRAHQDNYFLFYTNGTLIDKKVAKELAETGNATPAISVEGFQDDTDKRRGQGVYNKILEAMANLREAGVPFGISVTATRENAEKIISDEFVDYFFNKQGAVYGWVFQYMPIGRHQSLDLMVTPEQRKWMFQQEKHITHEKHLFFPDFWNGGLFSHGCLAGGRQGGYVYIEWNGHVTPCVFYPYSKDNINDIYARGGNLNDVLKSDLMTGIRKWQCDYGYLKKGKEVHNFIAPCGIRDHYGFTREHLLKTNPLPIDEDAREALNDPLYYKGMVEYDEKFSSLTEDIWQKEFIGEDGKNGKHPDNGKSEVRTVDDYSLVKEE